MGIENLVLPTAPGAESPSAPSVSRCTCCVGIELGSETLAVLVKYFIPQTLLSHICLLQNPEKLKTKLHKIGCVLCEILLGSPTPSKGDSVLEQE